MSARRRRTVVGRERFAARNRRLTRRRVLLWTGALGVLAALGTGVWAVGYSELTALEDVQVTSNDAELNQSLSDELVDQAEAPLGRPLIRVDTTQVEERLDQVREVSGVEVSRQWPSGLQIEVEPRKPVAAVTDGQSWWQVDDSGMLFAESADQPDDLPVIEVSADRDDVELRAAAVSVLDSLPNGLAGQVEEVSAESSVDVRLTLDDGASVRWGSVERSERKAEVLSALIAQQEEAPEGYDVSGPDRPAVQPGD